MAADSQDTREILETTPQDATKKIEKEIIKLTLGNARGSLHLFDITPFVKGTVKTPLHKMFAKFANSDDISAFDALTQYIINRIGSRENLFKEVLINTQEDEGLVEKSLRE